MGHAVHATAVLEHAAQAELHASHVVLFASATNQPAAQADTHVDAWRNGSTEAGAQLVQPVGPVPAQEAQLASHSSHAVPSEKPLAGQPAPQVAPSSWSTYGAAQTVHTVAPMTLLSVVQVVQSDGQARQSAPFRTKPAAHASQVPASRNPRAHAHVPLPVKPSLQVPPTPQVAGQAVQWTPKVPEGHEVHVVPFTSRPAGQEATHVVVAGTQ